MWVIVIGTLVLLALVAVGYIFYLGLTAGSNRPES